MSNSGLVFPIIVALWLVYLVPQWIRRREHLSSSRTGDRFSQAMRVLPRPDDAPPSSRPGSGSYVLSAPRSPGDRPARREPTRALTPSVVAPTPPLRDHAEVAHSFRAASGVPRRARLPGLTFLAAFLATPVLGVLAVLGVVSPWWPLTSLGVLGGCLVLLRRAAVRRRTARQAARRHAPQPAGAPAAGEQPAERRPVAARVVAAESADSPARSGAGSAATAQAAAEQHTEEWTPVPVPPPTYTLKPSAPARRVAAWVPEADVPAVPDGLAAPATGDDLPERAPGHLGTGLVEQAPAEEPSADEPARPVMPDLDLVLERRRASGE